jgi:DNA-binding NarL/FixJ family response regulator
MMDAEKIKVILADDHDLYRDGLRLLLGNDNNIKLLGEASNGRQLVQLTQQYHPDVILTDLSMPGISGIEAIKEICKTGKQRIIVLSFFESESMIVQALESGAIGYLNKNAQRGEVIEAIKSVYDHIPYYCSTTNTRLARRISQSAFNPYNHTDPHLFSEKEKEIIRLICAEKSSEEIGKILFMSKRTVDGIRGRLLEKMNVRTTAGMVIYAIKNSIYSLSPEEPANKL